jgi:hypothetical protein
VSDIAVPLQCKAVLLPQSLGLCVTHFGNPRNGSFQDRVSSGDDTTVQSLSRCALRTDLASVVSYQGS